MFMHPRFMFVVNSVRLLEFLISSRIIFHIFGARYLNDLNHNSPCLQRLVWNQFENADFNLYFLDGKSQTSNELKGYFLPCTTLYLTIEYFHDEFIKNYLSLEDRQMLIHYRYKRFQELFHVLRLFEDLWQNIQM